MTREEIEADLAALRQVKRARLRGETATKIAYSDGSAEYAVATLAEINGEIARLEMDLAKAGGPAHNLGPIRVGFGRRY